jgi:hypothetical protein
VVGTKENFESTEIGKLLGNTAQKLAKGDAVALDSQGHKVQLESLATIQTLHSARVVIALHLSADHIGVPEQKSICMTMGVTRLPKISHTATMPPMTSLAGVNPVANPAASAPALTTEVPLVSSE